MKKEKEKKWTRAKIAVQLELGEKEASNGEAAAKTRVRKKSR